MVENISPWSDRKAADWLCTFEPWQLMIREVRQTLEQDARSYPHEIRAAAAFAILFCRDGSWPHYADPVDGQAILELARRKLSVVRQMYALQGRKNPQLMANRKYKELLKSLEEEIRILDSRASEEDVTMSNQAPVSWGDFLGKRPERRNELD